MEVSHNTAEMSHNTAEMIRNTAEISHKTAEMSRYTAEMSDNSLNESQQRHMDMHNARKETQHGWTTQKQRGS